MARAVRVTQNFERNLAAVETFLSEGGAAPSVFDALLDLIARAVVPNLERYPRIGRAFLSRGGQSIQARERIRALRAKPGELREYVAGDYLVLYYLEGETVYLLSIKHHRQLSFDLHAHWLAD